MDPAEIEPQEQPEQPEVENREDGTAVVSLPEEKPRQTRKQRREQSQNDEVARWRQEAEAAKRQIEELRAQTSVLINQNALISQQQRPPQQQQQGEPDQYKTRLSQIRSEQESLQTLIRSAKDAADVQRIRDRYYQLDDERESLTERRATERALAEIQKRIPQAQTNQSYEEQVLRSEFPDVIGHPQAFQYAHGQYLQRLAEGEKPTLDNQRKALADAAVKFRIRQQTAPGPSETERQKFGSVPAQAAPRGTGREVTLDPAQRRMALQAWPNLEEHEAYARMAKTLRDAEKREKNNS